MVDEGKGVFDSDEGDEGDEEDDIKVFEVEMVVYVVLGEGL